MTPPRAAAPPLSTNVISLMRWTRTPDRRAASALLPLA